MDIRQRKSQWNWTVMKKKFSLSSLLEDYRDTRAWFGYSLSEVQFLGFQSGPSLSSNETDMT